MGRDEVPDFARFFQAAALTQEQDAFGGSNGQQVHDRGGVGRADAEVDHGQAARVGGGLHRPPRAVDLAVKAIHEIQKVVMEVRQQYIVAEFVQRHSRVTWQPVLR